MLGALGLVHPERVNGGRRDADIDKEVPPITRLARIIATIAVALTVLPVPIASAGTIVTPPTFLVEGDPTPAELRVIQDTWSHFAETFHRSAGCLAPLTVKVVDRAEDWFGGGSFAIAGFYRASNATVYIEHGKVTGANLAHEFAHHLVVSCDVAGSPLAADFIRAAGLAEGAPWYTGPSWELVPAEQFSEAVLMFLGIGPVAIEVAPAAVDLIQVVVWLGADGYGGEPAPLPLITLR
jgi:hypothetical protein